MTRWLSRLLPSDWDWPLLAAGLGLSCISLVGLSSAALVLDPMLAVKQGIWVAVGIFASLLVACVPYTRWIEIGVFIYPVVSLVLIVVLIAGTVKLGASRWITVFGFSMQPSELAKLSSACVVARYLSSHAQPISTRAALTSAVLAGVPALLIFLQPDLGTATIFAAIWFGAAWSAGMPSLLLKLGTAAMAVVLPCGWFLLKDYQRARLMVFVNPNVDPLGAGYTIIQSRIAIGSGQLFGRGWRAGTQAHLNFLPERHSDFLYSVVGEEWGFIGSVLVVALFGLLIWRGTRLAADNSDVQGRALAMGLTSWIAYQAIINMGMVMGVVPVVGVPLPFMSYGGSAMVTTWIALGILQSTRRFRTRF